MVVQSAGCFRLAGQIVIGVFLQLYRTSFKKCDRFVQHSGIASARNIAADRQR